jgi:predicted phage-related endonuclease
VKEIACTNEQEWLHEREKLAVTASDAYTLLTKPLLLYARKKGLIEGPAQSERMTWGKRLQGEIAKGFAEDTGRTVKLADPFTLFVHDDYPMVGATPDAIEMVPDRESKGAVEIKNTDIEWIDEPPTQYQAQIQVQMSVLDYKWGTLVALHRGNKLIWSDIMRHDAFLKTFLSKAEEFSWRLATNNPPPVDADGSDEAGKALAALFPKDTGSSVGLPPEALQWTDELEALKNQKKAIEEQVTLRESWLKEQIKDATYGVLVDGRRYSWKEQTRITPPRLEAQVSKFRVLKLLKGER